MRRRVCKACRCEAQKAIYREDPEVHRASSMRWYLNNRDSVLEKNHQKYNADPAANIERNRLWKLENPDYMQGYNAEYYEKNKEKLNADSRERNAKNRPQINRHQKLRYDSDHLYKLTRLLRGRVVDALAGKTKSARTVELLGAPWVWVEVHLESLFKPGMTWENHGPVWHIDHIRPCASFDLADPEQQRMCFHWTNLQPLFALDNLRKSDTYDPL